MSLVSICRGLALNVGMKTPDVIATSSTREWLEAMQFANEAGEELARRVDWGALHTTATLSGTGTEAGHDLGADFARLSRGIAVTSGGGIVRPLTRAEWANLVPVAGVPRYFLLEGQILSLWPFLAIGQTATVSAQSKAWASTGRTMSTDAAFPLIDEELLLKGLIARWRRQKGMDYADVEAEYEAAIADFAGFDDRSRL
jgi:hypothetical protein